MADNREIVGWFFKNGRRIPIKGKKGSENSGDKYITKKTGAAPGYEYYSTDYDTSGGHVHKDYDTIEEARDFLRRNNVIKNAPAKNRGKDALKKNMTEDRRMRGKVNYGFPQKRSYTGEPGEDYIKRIMKEYGLGRGDAIRFIKDL